jgi:flagellar motor switch protein FliN/FliY
MALISHLPADDAANAAARALEQLIGHDVILSVGDVVVASPSDSLLPPGVTRSVALPFGNGIVGEITLVATEQFATAIEAATADASLVTGALNALLAAADTIEPVIHLQATADWAGEIATETLLTSVLGDFAIVPILENDEHVASVVVRVVDDEPTGSSAPPNTQEFPAVLAASPAAGTATGLATPVVTPAAEPVDSQHGDIVVYQFQPLGDGAVAPVPPRPLPLLNDVSMEVTAELGRMRMKVRDLVALAPGSVIELDRAAGSPVDVLVNGTLLATGEVVVIDEEVGIRVSEIVVGDN